MFGVVAVAVVQQEGLETAEPPFLVVLLEHP